MGSHSVICHPAEVTFPLSLQRIKAGTRFIDPERMKGWDGLVGCPVADGLRTVVVTHQLQVERWNGEVPRPETDVLPLCHATNRRFVCPLVTSVRVLWKNGVLDRDAVWVVSGVDTRNHVFDGRAYWTLVNGPATDTGCEAACSQITVDNLSKTVLHVLNYFQLMMSYLALTSL